ncbi:MAG TPA: ATP-binding protein [Methylomirabilota bacterium]|nr:ATP-binding protein [Methylomirabilota bacterium]
MSEAGKLYFLCGKMAAGKSTLARELAQRGAAILLVQDEWLEHLFPDDIVDVPAFAKFSARLRAALTDHICTLLSRGTSVVLDFPGNTRTQRAWFRELLKRAKADHELHFIDAPDELCKAQLRDRSRHLAVGTPWTTDAEFDAITKFFQPPTADEGFNVIRCQRAQGAGDDRREGSATRPIQNTDEPV